MATIKTICVGTSHLPDHVRCLILTDGRQVYLPAGSEVSWQDRGNQVEIRMATDPARSFLIPKEQTQYTYQQEWPRDHNSKEVTPKVWDHLLGLWEN